MHTSLVLVALMGPGAAPAVAAPEAPSWQESYRAAREAGRERGKPVAIFIGSGPAGWEKLTEEGGLTRRSRQLLAESYVCYYVDQSSSAGQNLAQVFEVSSGPGLIISTKGGDAQAFWHRGSMTQGEVDETLQNFTSVTAVRQTEKLNRARYSSLSYPDSSMRPANGVVVSTTSSVNAAVTYQPAVNYAAPVTSYPTANYAVPASYAAPSYAAPGMAAPISYGGYGGGFGGGFGGGYSSGGC
jgi:hypothetical protein